jgi:hypothetical protein
MTKIEFVEDWHGSLGEQGIGTLLGDRSTLKFALHTNEAKDGGAKVIILFDAPGGSGSKAR